MAAVANTATDKAFLLIIMIVSIWGKEAIKKKILKKLL